MDEILSNLPFGVMNIPLGPNRKPNIDLKKAKKAYESARKLRALVIESALYVETCLTSCILTYISGNNYKQHKCLRELIFDAEFCTFMQKRKMISQIFEKNGNKIICIDKKSAKELRSSINKILETRNIYAHGSIFIDGISYAPHITHLYNKDKMYEISKEFYENFERHCLETSSEITKLTKYFKTWNPEKDA